MLKIGIDIGGTKCAVVLGEYDGGEEVKFLDTSFFPTVKDGTYSSTLNIIEREIEKLLESRNLTFDGIESIGISCGGPLDSNSGVILSPPNLPGWDEVEIVDYFQGKYKIKTKLENDANACALAEWKFGAGKGKGLKNLIFLTCGTGFGAGFVLDGRLYSGTNGFAGEIGHVRKENLGPVGFGKSGSYEGFCSGGGIAQIAAAKLTAVFQVGGKSSFCGGLNDIHNVTAKTVAEAANNGDPLALDIYKTSGEYLGHALSMLIDLLNPQMIVLGSIYRRCENLLRASAVEVVNREALIHSVKVCEIVPAVLGDDIGLYAALAL